MCVCVCVCVFVRVRGGALSVCACVRGIHAAPPSLARARSRDLLSSTLTSCAVHRVSPDLTTRQRRRPTTHSLTHRTNRYREGIANGEDLASLKVSDERNTQHYRPGRKHQRSAGEGGEGGGGGGGGDVQEYTYDGTGTQSSSTSAEQVDQSSNNAKRYGYISYTDE